jgi:hypothetical protein
MWVNAFLLAGERGHDIYILTARGCKSNDTEEFKRAVRRQTYEWIDRYVSKTNLKGILFEKKKVGYCVSTNMDILVDDSPVYYDYAQTVDTLSSKILMADQPYNQHIPKESRFTAEEFIGEFLKRS